MDTLQLMKESAFHAENEESVACKGFNIPATGAASDVRVGSQADGLAAFAWRPPCAISHLADIAARMTRFKDKAETLTKAGALPWCQVQTLCCAFNVNSDMLVKTKAVTDGAHQKHGYTSMKLQVIGAGFGRTATASLKLALETLLHAPCYHMSEVLGNAGHIDLWLDAAAGNPDWNKIFGSYAATVDFPASNYWQELAEFYPEAKIVLSVRDAERWFRSTQETIFSQTLQELHSGTKWGRMVKATIDDHVGGDTNDKEAVIAAFNAHVENVKEAFEPSRLLVFEAKDGWEPLCKFLELPVPEEPYPHINSKEEFDAVFDLLRSPIGARAMNGEGMESGTAHEDFFEAG